MVHYRSYFNTSFYLNFENPVTAAAGSTVAAITVAEGILTRPLRTVTMRMYTIKTDRDSDKDTNTYLKSLLQYALTIPDRDLATPIQIKRSAFVKKVYGMKLSNGILTENSIDKPSEIEGLLDIPVKVAKAILSIPAQLIQFRIVNIKNEASLETEQQSLQKAQQDRKKNKLALETELIKAKLDAQKTHLPYNTDSAKLKLEAEKNLLEAQKNLVKEQKKLLQARKEYEEQLKK